MKTPGTSLWDGLEMTRCVHGVSHSRTLKSEKLKFCDSGPDRVARDWLVVAQFLPVWGVWMPKVIRLEELRIWWAGAVSRVGALRVAREIPSAGGVAVFQKFSFSESGPW